MMNAVIMNFVMHFIKWLPGNSLFTNNHLEGSSYTAQKMKFSIKDFISKCDQIRRKLQIREHLLKKSLMENFTFYAVLRLNSPC